MRRSRGFFLRSCTAACLVTGGAAQAQQDEVNPASAPVAHRPATANTGVTPPMGPPEDPFGDQAIRGWVTEGLRVTPAISLTSVRESNPLMSSPKGSSDSGTATDLAVRITPLQVNGTSAFFAVGDTRLAKMDSERDRRLVAQVQAQLPVSNWMLPVNLIYSKNTLMRGSLVSQESSSSAPLAERQTAVTTIGSVEAIRTFGLNTLTLGLRLTDTAIGDARTTTGDVQKSTASNLAQSWSAKLARPLTSESQWYVRGGYDQYRYDAGSQPVIGTRNSHSPALAVGLQGVHGPVQGMAEMGYQIKQAQSAVVPDSHSTIGALIASYAVSPSLHLNGQANRVVIETNLPGVSNILATTTGLGMDWRVAPKWIVQVDVSLTSMNPHPMHGRLEDRTGNITLLWKPNPQVLLALTAARTQRSVTDSLAGAVTPYIDTKTTLNLTYYP